MNLTSATIIALSAVAISVVATVSAIWSSFAQRRHMRLSVRPIAEIEFTDYENEIGVFIANKGLGPMKINNLEVRNNNGKSHDSVLKHMPEGIIWSTFAESEKGSTLLQNTRVELLGLMGETDDSNFVGNRDVVRKALKDLEMTLDYSDMYGKRMAPVSRSLSFFGRHFDS